jgi:hypothetical protein
MNNGAVSAPRRMIAGGKGGNRMFVEQRLYTCAPGNTAKFLKAYQAEGRAPQTHHLGQPIGYYISEIGMLNQLTTLWAYDSLNERVEKRQA